ncbi:NucA/NucB deoxyribonuclease domain-containing protein [Streptomyces sp. NPDC090077]|uniref:NucA/NucB deoxyribonuclease domain-containing protein n=1 Tax=Streptomyces sp. NPDC090077 TaxID=3365938 RepID=UPI0037F91E59
MCGSGAKACRVDKASAARTLTVGQDAVFEFSLSRRDPLVREAAEYVLDAQGQLAGHPGRGGGGKPLHRTMDKSVIAANRGAACPKSLERSAGQSCDEYPFASTKEGGASGIYSRRMINADHNSTAGGSNYLLRAYKNHRIIDGDAFWVAVS